VVADAAGHLGGGLAGVDALLAGYELAFGAPGARELTRLRGLLERGRLHVDRVWDYH
jgi:hypothetical protein